MGRRRQAGRKLGERVTFSELFGDKTSLLLYSWMFGPNWDKPCLSCTSLMDGFDRSWYSVSQDAALLVFKKQDGKIVLFWSSEGSVAMVWPYWDLMDLAPEGRPERPTPLRDSRESFREELSEQVAWCC